MIVCRRALCDDGQVKAEGGKFVRIMTSDATNNRNDDFARSAYILYDTPKRASTASQKLNKMRVYGEQRPVGEEGCSGLV